MSVIGVHETDGLALAIYSSDEIVVPKGGIPAFIKQNPEANTFLRAVMAFLPRSLYDVPASDRLGKLLKKIDEELELLARLCGANVLYHQWGLWDMGKHRDDFAATWPPQKLQLPDNHAIVANVPVIRDIEPVISLSTESKHILLGLSMYEGLDPSQDRLYDRYDQIRKGAVPETHLGAAAVGLWWPDVEPRLRRRS